MRKNHRSNGDSAQGERRFAYQHILDQLRARIGRGEYAIGEKLPTDEMLMSEFGVCRYTARAAVQVLVADDLVRRYRGKGSFVVATPETSGQWALNSLDDLIDHSFAHTVLVRESRQVPVKAHAEAAAILGRKDAKSVYRLLVVREDKGGPYTCSEVFLPTDLVRRLPAGSLSGALKGQIIRMLEQHCGLRVSNASQVASAAPAHGEIARQLQVADGTPLLVLERQYATGDGSVIEYSRVFCRPDRYRQTIEFRRRNSEPINSEKAERRSQRH
jgi:GntR family transcriptional regulator